MRRRSKRYEYPTLFISGNIAHRIPLFTLCPEANEIFLANLNFYRRKYEFRCTATFLCLTTTTYS